MSVLRATKFVQNILENKLLSTNCIAIDATMGNGNDTLFLSNLVGKDGKVYSFDIQRSAIEKTKVLLEENNINEPYSNINLILDSHGKIEKYIEDEIDIAMFNLGYLPGGDHSVITRFETTIKALESILNLLKKGGIISLIVYYGHEGGNEEKNEVISFVENLDAFKYKVLRCDYINQDNNPPIILFIEKK